MHETCMTDFLGLNKVVPKLIWGMVSPLTSIVCLWTTANQCIPGSGSRPIRSASIFKHLWWKGQKYSCVVGFSYGEPLGRMQATNVWGCRW